MPESYAVNADERACNRTSEAGQSHEVDLVSATRTFQARNMRTRSIPLPPSHEEPNEASLEAIRKTEEIFANGGGRRFRSVAKLIESLVEQEYGAF